METLNFINNHIDYENKNFRLVIYLTTVNLILHGILPTLQYKYKLISKFTGDDLGRAADFLAYILIHIGTFRNYAFAEAVYTGKRLELGIFNYVSTLLGFIIFSIGALLVFSCFKKLGLRGMYFGDHFGFRMKKLVTSFPYNYVDNPQYLGNILVYFGVSVIFRSVAGCLLTITSILFYQVLFHLFEKNRIEEIYKDEINKN
jgi:phosphatidylethanolamine N-methyltransferase